MSAPSLTTGVGNGTAASVGVELPVANLTCPTCVQSLESALRAVPGVTRATVNLATARAFVEYDPKRTDLAAVHEAMKTAGYRVGTATVRFAIKGIMCASCVTKIERALHSTRRPDWGPMGLTLTVWVCTLPLVLLLIMPWFGVRVAIVAALVLLVVEAIVCWILCVASRVDRGRPTEEM